MEFFVMLLILALSSGSDQSGGKAIEGVGVSEEVLNVNWGLLLEVGH